jgi:cellulose synthase/poly-beta-1,6-N-acetylglucosamine synthase-like glycosyltransferase
MNPGRTTVSAVIPAYNYGRFLKRAIESVLAQTRPLDEIIVIDDGSTDDTREVVSHFGDRVRYIYQENGGLPYARNRGIAAATSDWIAFLDADDWWLPEKIQLQLDAASQDPAVALVYTGMWLVTPEGTRTLQPAIEVHRLWPTLRYCNCVSNGSAAMIRKSALLAEGAFNESLRACEDWDMWIRLARKYKFACVPEPVTAVAVWPNSMSTNNKKMLDNTAAIIDKTLLCDLGGLDRGLWRRRIWSAQLFSAAITARSQHRGQELRLLAASLLQWPFPTFLPKRWASLALNLARPLKLNRPTGPVEGAGTQIT